MKTFNELLREMDTLMLQEISKAMGLRCRTSGDWEFLAAVDMEIQDREKRNG